MRVRSLRSGYVDLGLVARRPQRRPDGVGIEPAPHEEHPDALNRLALGRHRATAQVTCQGFARPDHPRLTAGARPRPRVPGGRARRGTAQSPRAARRAAAAQPRSCVDRAARAGLAAPPTSARMPCRRRSRGRSDVSAWPRWSVRQTRLAEASARLPIGCVGAWRGTARRPPSPPRGRPGQRAVCAGWRAAPSIPYSASLMPSTPTSMLATLPRISPSIFWAMSGFCLRKSREFSRPWPRRMSP